MAPTVESTANAMSCSPEPSSGPRRTTTTIASEKRRRSDVRTGMDKIKERLGQSLTDKGGVRPSRNVDLKRGADSKRMFLDNTVY